MGFSQKNKNNISKMYSLNFTYKNTVWFVNKLWNIFYMKTKKRRENTQKQIKKKLTDFPSCLLNIHQINSGHYISSNRKISKDELLGKYMEILLIAGTDSTNLFHLYFFSLFFQYSYLFS